MVQEQIQDAKTRMEKAIESLRHELGTVRTGRASPGLVEHLRVDYYGAPTSLNQLATISTPDARLIVIQPYDRGAMGGIEKAILKSDLGKTPASRYATCGGTSTTTCASWSTSTRSPRTTSTAPRRSFRS